MKVFISYRRADSQVVAGRLAQFLDGCEGVDAVFLDVDDIAVGDRFERAIGSTLGSATHVFVLIGAQWHGPRSGVRGRARLHDAEDPVRQEVAAALRGTARVVPILIDAAPLPQAADLPDDLKELPQLHAFPLRSAHFDEDVDNLLDVLLGGRAGRVSRWRQRPLTPAGAAWRALGGLFSAAALLLVTALVNRLATDCYDLACTVGRVFGSNNSADALGLLITISAAVLAAGAAAPFVWRALRRRKR